MVHDDDQLNELTTQCHRPRREPFNRSLERDPIDLAENIETLFSCPMLSLITQNFVSHIHETKHFSNRDAVEKIEIFKFSDLIALNDKCANYNNYSGITAKHKENISASWAIFPTYFCNNMFHVHFLIGDDDVSLEEWFGIWAPTFSYRLNGYQYDKEDDTYYLYNIDSDTILMTDALNDYGSKSDSSEYFVVDKRTWKSVKIEKMKMRKCGKLLWQK